MEDGARKDREEEIDCKEDEVGDKGRVEPGGDEEDDGDGKEDDVQVREDKVEDDDKLLENGSDAPAAPLVEPPGRDNGTMEGR